MEDHDWTLIRKAGPFEVLSNLFHDLGIQSNVLVTANYTHHAAKLTPELLYPALAQVIAEHPALSVIGVTLPSEKKKGNHRLWEARLPTIDLKGCVEFVDEDGDRNGLARLVEKCHNEWFDTKDKTKPWWKIIVSNGARVAFLYHHSIADGISGYAFHRSLLSALNRPQKSISSILSTPDKPPPPCPLDEIKVGISWLKIIYDFLFWTLIRFFVNQKYFLFSDAHVSPAYPTVQHPFPPSERTITNAEILRIDNETMSKCLAACRVHNASFTALLHTLVLSTLATDLYPKSKFGFSRLAVNIRSLLQKDDFNFTNDTFTNAASAYGRVHFLKPYRIPGLLTDREASSSQDISRQTAQIWNLSKKYKDHLNYSIHKSGSVLQSFLTGKLFGEDNEEIKAFYGLGLYQNNSFLISNLGVFEPLSNVPNGAGWRVDDIAFSAGAIRAALGDWGMVFNVAATKGGDCVVVAVFEGGVLKREMVRDVLDGVGARLRRVLG